MAARLVVALVGLMSAIVAAQAPPRQATTKTAAALPRAADGHPDLGGTWYFGTATPLERPRDLAGKTHFASLQEAAEFEQRTAARIGAAVAVHPPDWLDYGKNVVPDLRTSLIIDPPDGRVPPLTDAATARLAARQAAHAGTGVADDDPEQRSPQERCLVFSAGPPVLPGPYNNNLQIVHGPKHLVVYSEMIHDARIIPVDGPLDRRPPLPARVTFWLGSSRGRWEGDTLVVETTNFNEQVSLRGSDEHLKIIERFTLERADVLRYEYTVDDPTAFTRPWTAAFPMTRTSEPIYEYACHEGNYGLLNTLRGARAADRERTGR